MEVSQQVLEWQNKARLEGIAQGRAEAMAQGKAEGWSDSVILVLRARFGSPLPVELETLVRNETDLTKLERWFDSALTSATLDEFRQSLTT